jgi:hypothetical protein
MPKVETLSIAEKVVHPPKSPFLKCSEIRHIPVYARRTTPSVEQKVRRRFGMQYSIVEYEVSLYITGYIVSSM